MSDCLPLQQPVEEKQGAALGDARRAFGQSEMAIDCYSRAMRLPSDKQEDAPPGGLARRQ